MAKSLKINDFVVCRPLPYREAGSTSIGVFQNKSIYVSQIGSLAQLTFIRFLRINP